MKPTDVPLISAVGMSRPRQPLGSVSIVLATLALCGLNAPGAIAQVTNQSDISGASPDVIYSAPADFTGLAPTSPDLVVTAGDLAEQIGDTYEACMAVYEEADGPEAQLALAEPCEQLEQLIDQADEVLESVNQQWDEQYQQVRAERIW